MSSAKYSRPLRIAVDGRALNQLHLRGIGRYLAAILRTGDPAWEWCVFSDRPDLPIHITTEGNITVRIFASKGHRFRLWEQVALPAAALYHNCDVLFFPATTAAVWQPIPSVVTVHDVIPWLTSDDGSEGFSRGLYRDSVLPLAYRRARALICPSMSAAGDVAGRWPEVAAKLVSIPHGIDDSYFNAPRDPQRLFASFGISPGYLLYLGGEIPRKRLDWALRVWQSLSTGVPLVVCGVNAHAHDQVRQRVREDRQKEVHLLPFVSEKDMPLLYAGARAILYPSLYEGFGFPVLEAQACGTPVVFSAVSSLAELVGPAAHVLPPDDIDAWVATCEKLLSNPMPCNSRSASVEWARNFSWARSVDAHLEVLRGALAKPRTRYTR